MYAYPYRMMENMHDMCGGEERKMDIWMYIRIYMMYCPNYLIIKHSHTHRLFVNVHLQMITYK